MWIITEHYGACNLSLAYRIDSVPVMKGYNVIAEFLVATQMMNITPNPLLLKVLITKTLLKNLLPILCQNLTRRFQNALRD